MKRGDDGNVQVPQQGKDEAAGGSAINAELMLQADDIRIAEI